MSLRGATVLVTGGTGFIGGRLIEVLVDQFDTKVKVLARSAGIGAGAFRAACCGVEFVHELIFDEDRLRNALKDVDYVFHCAFGSHGNEREQRKVTVTGTHTLAKAAAKAGVKRFVNLSTLVVFGDRTPRVVDETFTPVKPWSWNYARDKWEAEQLVAAEHSSGGLEATTVRLGAVYGPWGPAFTVGPIAALATHRIALAASGAGVSSATYIDDAVQGIILAALGTQTSAETYIIAGSDRVTWREFYAAYEAMTGRQGIILMTVEELRLARRARLFGAVQTVLPAAITALKDSKAFRQACADLPLIRAAYSRLISRKRSNDHRIPTTATQALPIALPPKEMVPYLSSQTEYSIGKAIANIGYRPQFSLQTGMALTEEWARWARLV